jgi:peptidoglycan/LPS O-acetylase OafA/YrhL
LDYLRAFIVLLVLLQHSGMAYVVAWDRQPATFKIMAAPILDSVRWIGFDVLVAFNDSFFMTLMFLLSGLFVWQALERKGGLRFLRDRILRLGVPFAVVTAILMPLAYYPSYAVTGANPSFSAYADAWLALGFWSSGPVWFIWLLLAFDAIAAGVHALSRRWTAMHSAQPAGIYSRPAAFAAALLVISALVYVPIEWAFGAGRWIVFGPFAFQASRLLLYAVYFGAGIQLGARGLDSGLLAGNAGLARQWPLWLAAGLAAYLLRLAAIVRLGHLAAAIHPPLPLILRLFNDLSFVLCCCTISLAFIGLFCRFAIKPRPILDSFSANSYGMYLIHYPIVVWLQYALLAVAADGLTKGIICAAVAIVLSWAIVAGGRRVRPIVRVRWWRKSIPTPERL